MKLKCISGCVWIDICVYNNSQKSRESCILNRDLDNNKPKQPMQPTQEHANLIKELKDLYGSF
jgi:hypothetical protein